MVGIAIDFVNVINKADELEEHGERLSAIADRLEEEAMQGSLMVWTEQASEEYRRKLRYLINRLRARARFLKWFAGILRGAAERLKKAEEAARNIIDRIFGG